jgi:acetyl esterase/lipase
MSIQSTQEQFMLEGEALNAQVVHACVLRNEAAPAGGPVVLHLHGGSFVSGSPGDGDGVAMLLAQAGALVVSAGYPLAPAHPFPQAINHVFKVLKLVGAMRGRWGRKKSKLVVAGEEAGGNLAAAVAMMARDQQVPDLSGQILIAPMLDPCMATSSIRKADAGPVGCRWADGWSDYLGSAEKAAHPYASPANASRLSGLAPALVVTAADDPMRDESCAYAARLRAAGVLTLDAELSGPTAWPCSMQMPRAASEPWAGELRDQFIHFFEVLAIGSRTVAADGKA